MIYCDIIVIPTAILNSAAFAILGFIKTTSVCVEIKKSTCIHIRFNKDQKIQKKVNHGITRKKKT